MENVSKYAGLCSNCKNAPTCTYPRDSRWPVRQCDEYECIESSPAVATHKDMLTATGPQGSPGAKEKSASKYVGLCSNCENCATCTFPRPEGGVWQCEEYR